MGKKFKGFSNPELNRFRSEFEKVAAKFEKDFNVTMSLGRMSYDVGEFTAKVTAKVVGVQSESDKMTDALLAQNGIARTNEAGDKVTDYNTRSPKFPIEFTLANGDRKKTTIQGAQMRFPVKEAEAA